MQSLPTCCAVLCCVLRALRTLRALAAAADVERAAPAGGGAGRAPCGAPRGRHRLPAALAPLAGSAPPRGLSARPRDAGGRCRPGPRPGGALGSARPPRPVAGRRGTVAPARCPPARRPAGRAVPSVPRGAHVQCGAQGLLIPLWSGRGVIFNWRRRREP